MDWRILLSDTADLLINYRFALAEAEANAESPAENPKSRARRIHNTLTMMSTLADQQSARAKTLGTPAALGLAAKTHARVAHAAAEHGMGALVRKHSAAVHHFTQATKSASTSRSTNPSPAAPVTPARTSTNEPTEPAPSPEKSSEKKKKRPDDSDSNAKARGIRDALHRKLKVKGARTKAPGVLRSLKKRKSASRPPDDYYSS